MSLKAFSYKHTAKVGVAQHWVCANAARWEWLSHRYVQMLQQSTAVQIKLHFSNFRAN